MSKLFTKTVEDFTCEKCGREIAGDGYTNHCPECLCSKHVDINPGDRSSTCGGIMDTVNIELKGGQYILRQRCVKCGFTRNNKASEADMPAIIRWSKNSF